MARMNWRGESFPATILQLLPSSIRVGDFVMWDGEPCEVITVQPNCPHIENLAKVFTMFTLKNRAEKVIPVMNLCGRQTVIRVKKKKVVLV